MSFLSVVQLLFSETLADVAQKLDLPKI